MSFTMAWFPFPKHIYTYVSLFLPHKTGVILLNWLHGWFLPKSHFKWSWGGNKCLIAHFPSHITHRNPSVPSFFVLYPQTWAKLTFVFLFPLLTFLCSYYVKPMLEPNSTWMSQVILTALHKCCCTSSIRLNSFLSPYLLYYAYFSSTTWYCQVKKKRHLL